MLPRALSTSHKLDTCGKRVLQLKKCPPLDCQVGKSVGVFLISDWCGRIQYILGGAIPGQEVLGM